MTKVVKSPRMHHDMLMNLRYVQTAIDKLGIERKIDVISKLFR
jgi:hypothetical protein